MSGGTSVSAARWLVGVMSAVVLAFLLATFAAQHLEDAIASRANDIGGNAMPSVQLLSRARGDLHDLERTVERDAMGDPAATDLRADGDIERQNVAESIEAYRALPFFAGEPPMFAPVLAALAALDADRTDWLATRDAGALLRLRRDFIAADQGLQRTVEFDAEQGTRLGLEIERIRGQTKGIVALLDGVAVALALVGVALALRQLRRVLRARVAEEATRKRRDAELSAQVEALSQFSARVAHDVLSPLGTTMFALEIVRQACHDDRAALRATDRAAASVLRVRTLVDGLLAFARAGGQPEADAFTELAPVITDTLDGLSAQANQHDISLAAAPLPSGIVACSAGVLTSIVSNLVVNAIKYMGDARIRAIDVGVTDLGDRYHIEISDTGPGIAVDKQDRIFEPYFQIEHDKPGIGLGLATVDRLVRAHGGSVGVRSRPGTGSTFWVELPKPTTPSATTASGRPAPRLRS